MRALLAVLLALCALPPLAAAVSVHADAGAEEVAAVVGVVVRRTASRSLGDLEVRVSGVDGDERFLWATVSVTGPEGTVVERPVVPVQGWEASLRSLLASQLEADLPSVEHLPAGLVLDGFYASRPVEGVTLRPGDLLAVRDGGRRTGTLLVRSVQERVVRYDAVADHGMHLGEGIVPLRGWAVEVMAGYPLGGEVSWHGTRPYPFSPTVAVGWLDDHVVCEAGLEKIWPLSSLGRIPVLRNCSLGASVRAGVAFPLQFGAAAALTWRVMVGSRWSLVVSGRLLYYGNQEKEERWQDGYQLLAGCGYMW